MMKKKPIKAQIKTLYINLRREVNYREKYYNSKSDNWRYNTIGIDYENTLTKLDNLLSEIESGCFDLRIELPYLK